MAKFRKGGPKRKEGARDRHGRLLQQTDLGTQELLAHKIAATCSTRQEMSALGVLRGRSIIDEDHYEAGLEFERCYRAYIGRPDPKASSLQRQDRTVTRDLDEAYLARMKIRYWNSVAALNQIGAHILTQVRDICLYERTGGLIGHIIAHDIIRADGLLIARREKGVPPALRQHIGTLIKGLEALDRIPRSDYSNEANTLIATLQARASREQVVSGAIANKTA